MIDDWDTIVREVAEARAAEAEEHATPYRLRATKAEAALAGIAERLRHNGPPEATLLDIEDLVRDALPPAGGR